MERKILVTYASRGRTTQEVAQAVAEELVKRGEEVDMRFILDVSDIVPYNAIVLGSAMRSGQWLPEAVQFVKVHQNQLLGKSVAYFSVCLTLRENTLENREKILSALTQVRSWVEPVDIGLFAGALERRKLKFTWRILSLLLRLPEGDFRDFHAIRSWAVQLTDKL